MAFVKKLKFSLSYKNITYAEVFSSGFTVPKQAFFRITQSLGYLFFFFSNIQINKHNPTIWKEKVKCT